MSTFLTEQDVRDYGTDLVDFAQRAAWHSVAPHLQNLEAQNHALQRRLAQEARHRLDSQVEAAIPNYRELDQHPDWHTWLLGVDSLSGRQRQQLLDEAKSSGDAARCIHFFRSFFSRPQSAAGSGASAASPAYRRARSSNEPIYTRPQIQALYAAHRKGMFAGKESEWARIEAQIIAVGREGRIANPIDPSLSK
jgi:hypothetical protein